MCTRDVAATLESAEAAGHGLGACLEASYGYPSTVVRAALQLLRHS